MHLELSKAIGRAGTPFEKDISQRQDKNIHLFGNPES
jgi:hypothetical protein